MKLKELFERLGETQVGVWRSNAWLEEITISVGIKNYLALKEEIQNSIYGQTVEVKVFDKMIDQSYNIQPVDMIEFKYLGAIVKIRVKS